MVNFWISQYIGSWLKFGFLPDILSFNRVSAA